jgi:hypothetical protein
MPVDSISCQKNCQSGHGDPIQYIYLKGLLQLRSILRTSRLANLDKLDNGIAAPPCPLIGSLIVPQNLLCGFTQYRALISSVVRITNIITQRARKARDDRLVVSREIIQLNRFVDVLFALGLTGSPEQDLIRVI